MLLLGLFNDKRLKVKQMSSGRVSRCRSVCRWNVSQDRSLIENRFIQILDID